MIDLIKSSASFSLGLIVFYFVGTMLSIANYVSYFRYHEARYGRDLVNAMLAFTVLGTITYALFSALCWVWAFKYVKDGEERLVKIGYGMFGIFLMHDCPLFVIQFHAYLCCGGLWHGLQGTVYVVQWIEFLLSFTFAWQSYAWLMSGVWNNMYGEAVNGGGGLGYAGGPGLKTGSERVDVLPPLRGTRSNASENSVPLLPTKVPSQMRGSPRDFSPAENDWRRRDRLPSPHRTPIEDPNYRGGGIDSRGHEYIPVDRRYNINQPQMDRGVRMNAPPMRGNYDGPQDDRSGRGSSYAGSGGYSPGVVPPVPHRGGSIYMERGLL